MPDLLRTQQRYDHRLRQLIQTTGDLDLAVRYGVPKSTARGWLKQSNTEVVSIDCSTWTLRHSGKSYWSCVVASPGFFVS